MGKLQGRIDRELTLYVRHMAWLNTAPKPPEGSKRAQDRSLAPAPTRLESMRADKIVPPMPPNPAPHIIERLLEMGLTEAAGMGAGPLTWGTIAQWQAMTGASLQPWEASLIRKLSVEYLAESRRAEAETCPPPWRSEAITERQKEVELERLQMVLG